MVESNKSLHQPPTPTRSRVDCAAGLDLHDKPKCVCASCITLCRVHLSGLRGLLRIGFHQLISLSCSIALPLSDRTWTTSRARKALPAFRTLLCSERKCHKNVCVTLAEHISMRTMQHVAGGRRQFCRSVPIWKILFKLN